MKIAILISFLFTFLLGNSQNQSFKITFISKKQDDSFNYTVYTKVSNSINKFESKFEKDTIYYAQPGFDAFYNYVDRLHKGFLTDADSIQNSNRFIEISYLQNGKTDSTLYIEFDSSNDKLFEFINLINLQIPLTETGTHLLDELNNTNISNSFKRWNYIKNKCMYFSVAIEINEKKQDKNEIFEIFSDNTSPLLIIDTASPIIQRNCSKYEFINLRPQHSHWQPSRSCWNSVEEISLLDSLINYTGHDFMMDYDSNPKKGKITIYCYEFGGLKYKKYIPLSEKDNFFKFIYFLQSIEKTDDEFSCYNTINDFIYSRKEYDDWKLKNKKP